MPYSNTAMLLSFFDPSVDRYPELAAMFTARGYQVAANSTMDLATLRNLPNQPPIGVLYIFTHGMEALTAVSDTSPDATLSFGLATTQSAAPNAPAVPGPDGVALAADIKAGRVVADTANMYSRDPSSGKVIQTGTPTVYYTTKAFFDYYWKGKTIFSPNSLVFINGCFSADNDFQTILTGCGAGLILGWNWPTLAEDAASTVDYVFDRMLGTNNPDKVFFPEQVPQRPFTWGQASTNMANFQSIAGNNLGNSVYTWGGTTDNSQLAPVLNSGGLLVPSILALGPIEFTKQLEINGNFGSQQGTVLLLDSPDANSGGQELNVQTWTADTVTTDLPPAGGSSSQGSIGGYIQIRTQDNRTSNCVPLTAYSGQVIATGSGDGGMKVVLTCDTYFRLDLHMMRFDFSAKPLVSSSYLQNPRMAVESADSDSNYTASGSVTDQYGTTSALSGSGELPSLSSVSSAQSSGITNYFNAILQFNPTIDATLTDVHDAIVSLSISQTATETTVVLTTTSTNGTTTSDVPAFPFISWGNVQLLQGSPSYDLPDPKNQLTNLGGILPNGLLDVQLQVQCAPDSSKGEDYMQVLSSSG